MPNNDKIIVGIDVGTHKICTIVAEAEPGPGLTAQQNRLNVLGVGAVASDGIAKGLITDIVKASSAIAHSLEAAERQSGCRILSAYVSISGNHISSFNSRGLVAVPHSDRVITQEDVERAIEAARAVAIPGGRDIMHVIPRTYCIDGQDGIRNPVGLSGFRLDVETHLVTGATNVRENLIRCVQKADVEVDDLVLSSLASAEASLTEQEKNLGVVHLDIGHGTTDIAIYVEGSVWHTRVIPIGGWQLSNDLSIVLNIPYEAAESLKLQYGRAVVPGSNRQPRPASPPVNGKSHPLGVGSRSSTYVGEVHSGHREEFGSNGRHDDFGDAEGGYINRPNYDYADDEMLETRGFEDDVRHISRGELNEVMAARFDQLFGMIGDEIRRSGYEGLLPGGAVLTGGVAAMPGIESLAQNKLRIPVRIARPKRIGGLAEAFDSPAYATAVGLVLWGLKQSASPQPGLIRQGSGRTHSDASAPLALNGPLVKWLRRFLPQG
jgi:cell division protein FtsA